MKCFLPYSSIARSTLHSLRSLFVITKERRSISRSGTPDGRLKPPNKTSWNNGLPSHCKRWEDMLKRWSREQGMLKHWRKHERRLNAKLWSGPIKRQMRRYVETLESRTRDEANKLAMKNQPLPGYDIAYLALDRLAFSPIPIKCYQTYPNVDKTVDETDDETDDETENEYLAESDWEDMLKRWMDYKIYGRPPKLSEADVVAWRVYEIAMFFKTQGVDELDKLKNDSVPPELFVSWLGELQGYVGSMELAQELHSANRLSTLLHEVLRNKHACIRAKTTELIATMVHNNPRSQELVVRSKGLEPLLVILNLDPDENSRTKALGAISALIRNNALGIAEFQLANGYADLRDVLSSENDIWLQREALNLIQYLLHENSSDCDTVTWLGLPRIMMHLASSDDAEVREAALRGLLVLARDDGGNSGQLIKNDKMKQVLQERIKGISAMAPEDQGVAREERELVVSLWNACYNEPPSFGEKGLLVLRGEDAPAPDVASKQFEPPRRACAAIEAADRNSVSEKRDFNIVTDLGLPCIMIHLASSEDAKAQKTALRSLLLCTIDEKSENIGQLVKNDDKLKQVLQKRIEGINAMAPEDLGAVWEEIRLVDSLWNACYKEPSSLKLFELQQLLIETLLVSISSRAWPSCSDPSCSKQLKLHQHRQSNSSVSLSKANSHG